MHIRIREVVTYCYLPAENQRAKRLSKFKIIKQKTVIQTAIAIVIS
jgi:hypothetical protein